LISLSLPTYLNFTSSDPFYIILVHWNSYQSSDWF